MYTEEKFEDEEDMHEEARAITTRGALHGHELPHSSSDIVLENLILLANQHKGLYPVMVNILNHYSQILQRDVGMYVVTTNHLHSLNRAPASSKLIYSPFSTDS